MWAAGTSRRWRGVIHVDKDRPTDGDDYAIGSLAIGKHLSEAWSAEVLLNGTKLQGDPNLLVPDLTVWGGSLDLLRVFNRSGRFSPYIGVGAGALEYDVKPGRTRCRRDVASQSRRVLDSVGRRRQQLRAASRFQGTLG